MLLGGIRRSTAGVSEIPYISREDITSLTTENDSLRQCKLVKLNKMQQTGFSRERIRDISRHKLPHTMEARDDASFSKKITFLLHFLKKEMIYWQIWQFKL